MCKCFSLVFSLLLVTLAAVVPAPSQAAVQRSAISIQIHSYLDAMKGMTATPWSIDERYELVGRTESQRMTWQGTAENMVTAILTSGPSDIDEQIIDDLINQACDPWGWENPTINVALAHIGRPAITKLIDVIVATPQGGNRTEYYSRGLAEVMARTRPDQIDDSLIDKIATGADHPDLGTSVNFAEALGAVGPPARKSLPVLEKLYRRAVEEDKSVPVVVGRYWHDVVRWQIESITGKPYERASFDDFPRTF